MRYKRTIVLDIIAWFHSLLLFFWIYPLLASMLMFEGGTFWRTVTSCLLLLVPIILSWLLMQHIRNFILYLFFGTALSALVAFFALCWAGFDQPSGKLCLVLTFILSMIIFGVRTRAKITYGQMKEEFLDIHGDKAEFTLQEREIPNFLCQPHLYHLVWFTLLYVPGMFLRFNTCLYLMFGTLLLDIFLCLSYNYISCLYEYIRKNQYVANLPVSSMQKIHRTTGWIGALLLVLFMLPAILFGREFEPDLTTDKPLFDVEQTTEEDKKLNSASTGIVDTQLIDAVNQSADPPIWLPALMRIIGYICMTVFIISLIILFIRRVRSLGHEFAIEEEDEVVFLKPEEKDSSRRFFHLKGKESHLSANQQIRKRYRKTIRRATKGQPSKWATPSELERDANLANDEAMQTLHAVYEKARYSKDGCSHKDLNLL